MVRWMCNVRPEDSISADELRIRLKFSDIRTYLRNGRLQWLALLEWKSVLDLVNAESLRLVVLYSEDNLGKHGKR